jgi:hypothetical protein
MPRVIFLKEGIYYKGKMMKQNQIIEMSSKDVKAYIDLGTVRYYTKIEKPDYTKLTYKELQKKCTKNGLTGVGKKEDLIERLEGI